MEKGKKARCWACGRTGVLDSDGFCSVECRKKANSEADALIYEAIRWGRWEAVIGWWGQTKGLLEEKVIEDLHELRSGGSAEAFLKHCLDGAEPEDGDSWREYVEDLTAKATKGKP